MKKNITINLFGSLYAIDEDAYELLNQYQNNMRRYFSRKEGGEEIAEDIERRIAELFDELKASGVEAITIEHVRDIISRIGNPEEMDGTETEATADETDDAPKESERKENVHKKLFRNPDDKMLGGVTSGLACYFGIDPLWLRLLMILFAWFSLGTSIIIYLILWIIIPEAWTPEDRLRMQGRPVNMENLRDEIIDGARKAGQYASAPKTQKTVRGCLTVLLDIVTAIFKGFLFLVVGGILLFVTIMLIAILIGFCLYCFSAFTGGVSDGVFSSPAEQSFFNALINGSLRQGIYWTALISSITLLILTLYIGTHSILRMAGRIHPMTLPKRLALIGGWIITAVIFIASMIQSSISYDWYIRDYREEQRIRNDSLEHQRQLSYLEHEGWKVVRHKECGNNYVKSGEYYTGNRDVQYIDAWNFNRKMEYEVERTVHVTPGIYRLEAAARTDGQGCEIFACHDNRERKADVPVYGNQGGEIWQDAQRQQTSGNITLGMQCCPKRFSIKTKKRK